MSLHRCTESECPYFGQPTTKGCACHLTDEQVLRQGLARLIAAAEFSIPLLESTERCLGPGQHLPELYEIRSALADAKPLA